MRKIQIESLDQLNDIFKDKSVDMTNNIRESIQEAFNAKKKTALLFEIEFEGMDTNFEISITTKEWVTALENCLRHYEEWEHSDDVLSNSLKQ